MRYNDDTPTHVRGFGQWGEARAAEYLQQLGYTITARNWRTKFGEIDIIAQRDNTVYFFEVKSRASQRYGRAYEAVRWQKRLRIMQTAKLYVQLHPASQQRQLAFGVVTYQAGKLVVWPNAWAQ